MANKIMRTTTVAGTIGANHQVAFNLTKVVAARRMGVDKTAVMVGEVEYAFAMTFDDFMARWEAAVDDNGSGTDRGAEAHV